MQTNKPEVLKQITALVAQLDHPDDVRRVWDIYKARAKRVAAMAADHFHAGQRVRCKGRRGFDITGTIDRMGPSKALVTQDVPETATEKEREALKLYPKQWRVPYGMLSAL